MFCVIYTYLTGFWLLISFDMTVGTFLEWIIAQFVSTQGESEFGETH